jgi:nicotinate-nucleotide pyrophosphorylase (carboxylating)
MLNLEELIGLAIEEDLGDGDHTSLATIPADARGKAMLLIKEGGVLAGVEVARMVFQTLDPELEFHQLLEDGTEVSPRDIAFTIEGKVHSILAGERLSLNFMQRMSGIATATRKLAHELEGLPVKVLDTRKTTPLWRELEKQAVRLGGGENHRMGLYDMILIKDNHVDFAGGIKQAIDATRHYLRKTGRELKIEIEVRNMDELNEVLKRGGVDRIMLDNFSLQDLNDAVNLIRNKYETEASGGITLENIRAYARRGVDYISVGAVTHHIKSLDMSLKAVKEPVNEH